jgi:uncharacterized repeat protein (TIGR03803 family)
MRRHHPLISFTSFFALSCLLLTATPMHAQTETVLYSFTGAGDGSQPEEVILDQNDNLYGTTIYGGLGACLGGCGVVFEASLTGTEKVLHSFSRPPSFAPPANWEAGGTTPFDGLVLDHQGNLYGVTLNGGFGYGTVFKITPAGQAVTLHSFTGPPSDGAIPEGALILDAQGNLYGTTASGGSCGGSGCGTVFELTSNGTEKILHSFAGPPSDGWYPGGFLTFDAQGDLYGVTNYGGSNPCEAGCGVVFKVTPAGTENVLYNFTGGVDGSGPSGRLVFDKQGNMYGTAEEGGSYTCSYGCGTIFKLNPSNTLEVLYSFTSNSPNGFYPVNGVIFEAAGNLYGTTYGNHGTAFELSPNEMLTTLYGFCAQMACTDGSNPTGGLAMDGQGNLYGATDLGGAEDVGTIFKLTP